MKITNRMIAANKSKKSKELTTIIVTTVDELLPWVEKVDSFALK